MTTVEAAARPVPGQLDTRWNFGLTEERVAPRYREIGLLD
jgi:hypothetical protein